MQRYPLYYREILTNLPLLKYSVRIKEEEAFQLRSCQAWIIPAMLLNRDTGRWYKAYALQSYNTLVCIIDEDGFTFEPKKYSRTTSRQVTWFKQEVAKLFNW